MATLLDYLGLLVPRREALWSIGIWSGRGPFTLAPHPALQGAPVIEGQHLAGVCAHGVADPFMQRHDGQWHMFFEVENRATGRGEIGLASSRDALRWEFHGIVLREPFHLSYPLVFKHDGAHYMVPESGAAGGVRLYRANRFPSQWKFEQELVAGNFVDATLFRHEGRWWMIALEDFGRGNTMVIHYADRLHGPWMRHSGANSTQGLHGARPAGRVIEWQGQLVRFAQDGAPWYGRAVRAFVIERLTPTEFVERACPGDVLGPSGHGWNATGMHHADIHADGGGLLIACVDGRRTQWRWPVADRILARAAKWRAAAAPGSAA